MKKLYKFIIKLCQYAIILWSDEDYDYGFIYKLLRYKLYRTRKYIKKHDIAANTDQICHKIKVAELLLERLIKDDYCNLEYVNHEKKWGEYQFNFEPLPSGNSLWKPGTYKKAKDEKENEMARKENGNIGMKTEYLKKQDTEYLFKHLNKYIRTWWD